MSPLRDYPLRLSRRHLLCAGAIIGAAGCEPFGMDYSTVKTALAVATGIEDPPGVTLEQASAIPYASIGYRLGSSGESMLLLATDNGTDLLWTSSERVAITTRKGRIVSTGGFPWNLSQTDFPEGDPLGSGLQHALPNRPTLRTCDFRDVSKFSIGISSRFEASGPETISLLGTNLQTIKVLETCSCPQFNWNFTNRYWVDVDSGFVWRSIQNVHPNLGAISVSVLRPPS